MIQVELNCPKCAKVSCFLLPCDNTLILYCHHCAAEFGKSTPSSGLLYALKNNSIPGLLKIGFTTLSVEERVSELDSSTATPTPFEIVFYFACSEPQSDEAFAHESLARHRPNKDREFFKIAEIEALAILRKKLLRQEVFLNEKLRVDSYQAVAELQGLEETLRNKVIKLRKIWSSTEGVSKGISLPYRLMSECRYSAAKKNVNLFLKDNPKHGVALSLQEQINDKFGISINK